MYALSYEAYDVKKPAMKSSAWCDREICFAHKSQKWWISKSGVRVCGICAPPPDRSALPVIAVSIDND
ncbi:MAG: hypothetical protein RDV48_05390 [Candidatus Eremiobacteraeota bacterium]|nr:hypothetical protein [Candidatus Eremiobacteraeota bacterium]